LQVLSDYKEKYKKARIGRADLVDIMSRLNYHLTMLQATDAILYCRGEKLDKSDHYDE